MEALHAALTKNGIELQFGATVQELLFDGQAVTGVRVRREAQIMEIPAKAVIPLLAAFANAEWRTYLDLVDLAKVRGTRFNTGDGIRMALDVGAMPYGNWSGAHAVAGNTTLQSSGTWPSAMLSKTQLPLRARDQHQRGALSRRSGL